MGVRFNAEKKKIGNYYSTPILSFRMKCHLCSNWFEIQTDPKNAQYVVTAGARKKIEDFEPEDNETIRLDTPEELERRANDSFARLEHLQNDALKAKSEVTVLTRLQRLNNRQWSDPYALSQKLRKEFRTAKKVQLKSDIECKSIADRIGVSFDILPESENDREISKKIEFDSGQKAIHDQKLKEIKSGGLFSKAGSSSRSTSTSNSPSNKVARALASTITANTLLQVDPFLTKSRASRPSISSIPQLVAKPAKVTKTPLVAYGEDDSDDNDD
ncbi:hypothetical protein BGZ76_007462 [Entomortierella beljakovae]|nr:hypothetical protein BGZ76_007462 [Entomortierella beljakovae]